MSRRIRSRGLIFNSYTSLATTSTIRNRQLPYITTPIPPETPLTAQPPTEAYLSLLKTTTVVDPFYIKVHNFGFAVDDDKHQGLGPDVPKSNHVGRLNKYSVEVNGEQAPR